MSSSPSESHRDSLTSRKSLESGECALLKATTPRVSFVSPAERKEFPENWKK
jgi:hypothetical protein